MPLSPHPILHFITIVPLNMHITIYIRLSNQLPPIFGFPDGEENGIVLSLREITEERMMAIGPCFVPTSDNAAVGFREGVIVGMPIREVVGLPSLFVENFASVMLKEAQGGVGARFGRPGPFVNERLGCEGHGLGNSRDVKKSREPGIDTSKNCEWV